jgi:hypothetical protein
MTSPLLKTLLPFKTTTFAYYKGTRPAPLNPKAVDAIFKTSFDQCLKGFREDEHLTDAQIITILRGQLDQWEEQLCKFQERNPSRTGKEGTAEEWLGGAWGSDWKMIWALWYINIGTLIKLKALNNDDMNGWHIVKR